MTEKKLDLQPGDFVAILDEALSFDSFYRALDQPVSSQDSPSLLKESGAIVTFSGVVRETEKDSRIPHLDYEHYSGMAEKEMAKIIQTCRKKWPIQRAGIWHRVGQVNVGESSVLVGVCAGHREEAFQAARFLIDELKKTVPIWKKAPVS